MKGCHEWREAIDERLLLADMSMSLPVGWQAVV